MLFLYEVVVLERVVPKLKNKTKKTTTNPSNPKLTGFSDKNAVATIGSRSACIGAS